MNNVKAQQNTYITLLASEKVTKQASLFTFIHEIIPDSPISVAITLLSAVSNYSEKSM